MIWAHFASSLPSRSVWRPTRRALSTSDAGWCGPEEARVFLSADEKASGQQPYPRIPPKTRKWVDAQDEKSLYLSVLALGEIRKGASLLAPGNKRNQLEAWLETDLPLRFENRLLPIDATIAELWGATAAEAQLKGITLAVIDGLVAATAKHHDLVVVTRNVKDFTGWGALVINPWEG